MLGGRGWRRHIRCVGYWLSPPPPPSDKTRDFDDSAQPRLACPLGRRGSQRVFVNRQWLEGRWARNDWGHDLHAVYRIRTVEMQRATTEQENMHSGAGGTQGVGFRGVGEPTIPDGMSRLSTLFSSAESIMYSSCTWDDVHMCQWSARLSKARRVSSVGSFDIPPKIKAGTNHPSFAWTATLMA